MTERAQDTSGDESAEAAELIRFLENYGEAQPIQEPGAAAVDPQIKSLSLDLAKAINSADAGTVVDIGCGNGIMLQRLAELQPFEEKKGWMYLGADFDEKLTDIIKLAAGLQLHRRVDYRTLHDLYESWIPDDIAVGPVVVIVRNVLHEINIDDTAHLIAALANNLQPSDELIIQDLQAFPRAERGNACWQPKILRQTLEACGFTATLVEEVTRRGRCWFTVSAKRVRRDEPLEPVRDCVIEGRWMQYELWRKADALVSGNADQRPNRIALLDLDLQVAALANQLADAGSPGMRAPSAYQQSDVAKKASVS